MKQKKEKDATFKKDFLTLGYLFVWWTCWNADLLQEELVIFICERVSFPTWANEMVSHQKGRIRKDNDKPKKIT